MAALAGAVMIDFGHPALRCSVAPSAPILRRSAP